MHPQISALARLNRIRPLVAAELQNHKGFIARLGERGIEQLDAAIAAASRSAEHAAQSKATVTEAERVCAAALAELEAARAVVVAGTLDAKQAVKNEHAVMAALAAFRFREDELRAARSGAHSGGIVPSSFARRYQSGRTWCEAIEQVYVRSKLAWSVPQTLDELQSKTAKDLLRDVDGLPVIAIAVLEAIERARRVGLDTGHVHKSERLAEPGELTADGFAAALLAPLRMVEVELAAKARAGQAAAQAVSQ